MKATVKHINIDLKFDAWMNHESANLKYRQIVFVEPRIEVNNGVTNLVIPSKMNF